MSKTFLPGISTLVCEHSDWLRGRRIGLVANRASVDEAGLPSADRLLSEPGVALECLFAPEHGFDARAGAGENVPDARHPALRLPVHSLYGDTRSPTREMLAGLDTIVYDLQGLPVRCYTYVSTLRCVMGAAAEYGKTLVVADRPAPLPDVVDGPMLEKPFESFVGCVPFPLAYGMTPGEAALYLQKEVFQKELRCDLDLRMAKMQGYARLSAPPEGARWIPPSPGIRSWQTAQTYPATVFCEALPALDYGRGTGLVFQVIGAPWMDGRAVREALAAERLPGVRFDAFSWGDAAGACAGKEVHGARIVVTDPAAFRPVRAGVAILETLQKLYGADRIWAAPGTRPEFFDQLMGTDTVRKALQSSEPAAQIAARWEVDLRAFRERRTPALLYAQEP